MNGAEATLLLATGAAAGVVSLGVSLASLVSYPVPLAIGLPPLSANITNTVALVFTSIGSVAGSRPELAGQRALLGRPSGLTMVGGAAGAAVLLLPPAGSFPAVVRCWWAVPRSALAQPTVAAARRRGTPTQRTAGRSWPKRFSSPGTWATSARPAVR